MTEGSVLHCSCPRSKVLAVSNTSFDTVLKSRKYGNKKLLKKEMWENCKYWMQLYLTPCCSREIIILVHLQNPKLTSSGFRCLPNVLIKPSTLLNENEFLNFHNFHQTFSVFYAEQNSLLGKMSDDHLIFTWKVTWEGWPSDRIFIPWITLTIMSYSYHIHIDQQSINKWKY